jgi:hypothetical protein
MQKTPVPSVFHGARSLYELAHGEVRDSGKRPRKSTEKYTDEKKPKVQKSDEELRMQILNEMFGLLDWSAKESPKNLGLHKRLSYIVTNPVIKNILTLENGKQWTKEQKQELIECMKKDPRVSIVGDIYETRWKSVLKPEAVKKADKKKKDEDYKPEDHLVDINRCLFIVWIGAEAYGLASQILPECTKKAEYNQIIDRFNAMWAWAKKDIALRNMLCTWLSYHDFDSMFPNTKAVTWSDRREHFLQVTENFMKLKTPNLVYKLKGHPEPLSKTTGEPVFIHEQIANSNAASTDDIIFDMDPLP